MFRICLCTLYSCLYTLIPQFCSLYLLFPVVQTLSWSVFTDPPPYFCSILSFPLVPRVSWLRARGYIPSAFDWLRRTRDPLFRNLYNNNKLNWFIHNFKKLIIYLTTPHAQLCKRNHYTEYVNLSKSVMMSNSCPLQNHK